MHRQNINTSARPMSASRTYLKKKVTSEERHNDCDVVVATAAKSRQAVTFSSISGHPFLTAEVVDLTMDEELLIPQKCYQRDHCHMNYREKQDQRMKDLEEYTRKLRREIWDLKCRRDVTLLFNSTEPNVWTIAVDYFRNFRYGLTETNCPCASAFLGTTMARDVTDGSMHGPEAILNYWSLFSRNFDDILFELDGLEQGARADSLVATITLSVTISKNSLRLVFPHLLSDDRAGLGLAAQLINQRIVMRGSVLFQWDDKMKRLGRMHSQADMLTPILKIVGNLEKVGRVFERALVTPECKLVPEISNDSRYWMQFSKLDMERI